MEKLLILKKFDGCYTQYFVTDKTLLKKKIFISLYT